MALCLIALAVLDLAAGASLVPPPTTALESQLAGGLADRGGVHGVLFQEGGRDMPTTPYITLSTCQGGNIVLQRKQLLLFLCIQA